VAVVAAGVAEDSMGMMASAGVTGTSAGAGSSAQDKPEALIITNAYAMYSEACLCVSNRFEQCIPHLPGVNKRHDSDTSFIKNGYSYCYYLSYQGALAESIEQESQTAKFEQA
jgi:hypothetical protein